MSVDRNSEKYVDFLRKRRSSALREVMSTKSGRIFIATLIEETAPLNEAYKGNADTYYFLGKQSIGRHLLSQMIFGGPEMVDLFKQMSNDIEILKEEGKSYARS